MEIFGLEPFVAALCITAVGVALSVLLGWLKGTQAFNVKQVVASALIAFIVSMQLVIAQLTLLPADLEGLALGSIIFALIAQVSGIDSLAKSAAQAVSKARKST